MHTTDTENNKPRSLRNLTTGISAGIGKLNDPWNKTIIKFVDTGSYNYSRGT